MVVLVAWSKRELYEVPTSDKKVVKKFKRTMREHFCSSKNFVNLKLEVNLCSYGLRGRLKSKASLFLVYTLCIFIYHYGTPSRSTPSIHRQGILGDNRRVRSACETE
jgi:hypothetical protein